MTDWHETRTAGVGCGGGPVAELSTARSPHTDPTHMGEGSEPDSESSATVRPGEAAQSQSPFAATGLVAQKLSQILELLHDLPGGGPIYRDAIRILDDLQHSCTRAEQYFSELVDVLLQDQSRSRADDLNSRTEIELLRRHLRPPIVSADASLRARLEVLLANRPPGTNAVSGVRHPDPNPGHVSAANGEAEPGSPMWTEQTDEPTAARFRDDPVDSAAAEHEAKIDGLQQSLGREIRETLTQNEEFGVTLDLVLSELQRVREIGDAQLIRERLLNQVKRLHNGHFALAQKLDSADRYLSLMSLDRRNLNEELHRVRQMSLTDELTSLPNRRAFMARVEEEVARVERYGMPLSLAVIDLDRFKRINDEHGHAAGDEVLRCYATQIFSVFRNHDLVARYGGEEFAVLLPNTDCGGAAAALRKARECAARVRCRAEDTAFPVPSFSAGVATFQRGETAQRLMDRADEALYRAKRGGRDRVEFADDAISRP